MIPALTLPQRRVLGVARLIASRAGAAAAISPATVLAAVYGVPTATAPGTSAATIDRTSPAYHAAAIANAEAFAALVRAGLLHRCATATAPGACVLTPAGFRAASGCLSMSMRDRAHTVELWRRLDHPHSPEPPVPPPTIPAATRQSTILGLLRALRAADAAATISPRAVTVIRSGSNTIVGRALAVTDLGALLDLGCVVRASHGRYMLTDLGLAAGIDHEPTDRDHGELVAVWRQLDRLPRKAAQPPPPPATVPPAPIPPPSPATPLPSPPRLLRPPVAPARGRSAA